MEKINKTQKLVFELMKRATFNEFNGKKVVKDLIENKDLWRSVVMDREAYSPYNESELVINLIKLRDLEQDVYNVDTVFILPAEGDEVMRKLEKLAQNWNADEIVWITGREANRCLGIGGFKDKKILRIWWD